MAAAAQRKLDRMQAQNAWDTKMRLEREGEADARAQGTLTSKNRPFLDMHAIAGAGGDPAKHGAILAGTYFGGDEYRPDVLNEPRPEEQVSRDFTPAWDTTYGGPYVRRPDPQPGTVAARNDSLGEKLATSMANDFAKLDWLDRQSKRRREDENLEQIVTNRAQSTNKQRDSARAPMRFEPTPKLKGY